uniref:Protein STRUBBELIG-RECEPTOR FAMILY 8 n=1 Tax=Cajanus cajan TaxID=3821 RepID=A0A151TVG1_CAJCA|nr:Protein STRUBBELIG-RECEPTOR FAMILY 8 [Cajanus cajan]
MATIQCAATTILLLLLFTSSIPKSHSQQEYVNNKQLDCDNEFNSTKGNICNGVSTSCTSYLTFKSSPPEYATPSSISYLLNSTPSLIAAANNITDVESVAADTLLTVPINCSCSGPYYQHNASYSIKILGETYFTIANNTYQSLTTCQALRAQNRFNDRNLTKGLNLHVPLRCACPTEKQRQAGFNYLLTYLVSKGESISSIGEIFGVDEQSILDANELSANSVIFYFTPISVPLKTEPPAKIQRGATPPEDSPLPPPPPPDGDSDSSKKWVIVGIVVGVVLLLLVGVALFFLCRRQRKKKNEATPPAKPFSASTTTETSKKVLDSIPTSQSWSLSSEGVRYMIESVSVYKFEELQQATGFFSEENKIKGSVYRASFKGDHAAVKVLKGDVSGEINILKRINHFNIIRLSGFCVYKGDTYLVYEFAENDSLEDWLHNDSKKYVNSVSLSWVQRVQIAHDVADALNYLHNYTSPPHVHKNLKSGNVLLDGNFRAKISNFGLARAVEDRGDDGGFQLTRHVVGTQGYMAPEYIENGLITPKMDVFAFGVVVLELLSGREAIVRDKNGTGQQMLSGIVNQVLEGENVREKLGGFMDPNLRGEYPLDLAYSMAELAKLCVAHDLNSRPQISEVFMTLSKIQSSSLDWDPSDDLERSRSVSQTSDSRYR